MCQIILALLIISYIIITLVFRKKDRDAREDSALYRSKGWFLFTLSMITICASSLLLSFGNSLYTYDTIKTTENVIDFNKTTAVSDGEIREYGVAYKTDKGTFQINYDNLNKRSSILVLSEEPTKVEIEERKSFDMCFFIEVTDVTYTFS